MAITAKNVPGSVSMHKDGASVQRRSKASLMKSAEQIDQLANGKLSFHLCLRIRRSVMVVILIPQACDVHLTSNQRQRMIWTPQLK